MVGQTFHTLRRHPYYLSVVVHQFMPNLSFPRNTANFMLPNPVHSKRKNAGCIMQYESSSVSVAH
jgi:hypothetical protein